MLSTGPGRPVTPVLEDAPTGLGNTLGVSIIDGATVLVARTTGAVEAPAGSGIYTGPDLTAPTVAGSYLIVWDWPSGGGTEYAAEELIVDRTAATIYTAPAGGYVSRAQVEAEVTLPAGAAGDRIIARAERAIDGLLGPYPRDPSTGLKWDLARLYDWQAAAVQAAVIAQAAYIVESGAALDRPAGTVVKGPDFEVTYGAGGSSSRIAPRALTELEPLGDLIRVVGARARA